MGDCITKLLQTDNHRGDRMSIQIINADEADADTWRNRRYDADIDQMSELAGIAHHKRNTSSLNVPSDTIETNALTVPAPRQGVLKTISRFMTGSDNKSIGGSYEDLGLASTSKRGVRFSSDNFTMINLKSGFSMNQLDPVVRAVIESQPDINPDNIPELSGIYDHTNIP